ncbi:hypothetical protein [Mycolicibacterium fortuitum]|uniref:hypothetical protein n=1 Tax=Mycolicibacterium fortuitum TaxID=1766 RepID=UPI003AAD800A
MNDLSAARFAGQTLIYRGVRYTIDDADDLPDLLPDGTGMLLARNRRGDLVLLAVLARNGRIERAATLRGPWVEVTIVEQ